MYSISVSEQFLGQIARRPGRRVLHREHGSRSRAGLRTPGRTSRPPRLRRPHPVVLVFHGGGGSARSMRRYSRFDEVADQQGFVVAYPIGFDSSWNDGR